MNATAGARPKIARRPVHGVLLLDKDAGASSNAALQRAKRLYRAEKAGHTGTLDPLASGLLPLCFGAATKFAQASLDADKRYLATLRLGVTTTTGDREGDVVSKAAPVAVGRSDLEAACDRFVGDIDQVPPMHSALKRDGKPLYEYARAGIELERVARRVRIHSIDVVEGSADLWTLDVRCSKGTYIRTLGEDIGAALGCGAHLDALRRVASGALDIGAASTLAQLDGLDEAALDARLLPPDALVAAWPRVVLSGDDAGRFLSGVRRRLDLADAPALRVYGPEPGAFLGTGHVVAGELIASRLLSPAEVGALVVAERRPHLVSESLFA
ncbi:MAG TPA: tRNA pseudouridine(55) synthase TruB [Caldimonas sp.]|nr:tRNA pseudouridine(55) synthase TruB [Caldimonas sp.]